MIITRSELYEQVWTEPMLRLAKRYGLSDRGLAKICGRNDIPCPPRGYWAKKQSGRNLPRKLLPRKDIDQTIEIRPNPLDECNPGLKKEISAIKQHSDPIVVPDSLRNPHPLVKQSAQILSSCEPDSIGIIEQSRQDCLNIRVSKKNLSRSLLIMDALIKALESHGYEVSISKKATEVRISGVSLSFAIYEEQRYRRLEAKNHDLDGGYYQFGYNQYNKQPTPTGNLCLVINDPGFWRGGTCRQSWNDGKSQRVEDCLNSFISGLLKTATLKKKHVLEEQARQKEKDEQL